MTQLFIFDCDGVLVDTEHPYSEVTATLLNELGVALSATETIDRYCGLTLEAMIEAVERDFDTRLPDTFDDMVWERAQSVFKALSLAIPGIHDVIDSLARPFCVASNSQHEWLDVVLENAGLKQVTQGRRFSAMDVANPKPAPDIYIHAARTMTTAPEECLVIEDSIAGVTAARAAGMPVVGFLGASHVDHTHGDRLRQAGANHVVTSHDELKPLLRSLVA